MKVADNKYFSLGDISADDLINKVDPWGGFVKQRRVIRIDNKDDFLELSKLIYLIENTVSKIFYIGKADGTLINRFTGHLSTTNKKKKRDKETSNLHRDLYKKPQNFRFGVLRFLKQDEDIDVIESDITKIFRAAEKALYNVRLGGAGGLSHASEVPVSYGFPINAPITPEKYYPIKWKAGRLEPQFSPQHLERIKCLHPTIHHRFVYVFKNTSDQNKCSVGVSSDPFVRIQQHCQNATKITQRGEECTNELYQKLADKSNVIVAGVLPIECKSPEEMTASEREKFWFVYGSGNAEKESIIYRNSYLEGYNDNPGGGGPVHNPKNSIVKRLFE